MTSDRDVNARLNLIPDPQAPQKAAQMAQQVNQSLQQANQGRPLLQIAEDLNRVQQAGQKAATTTGAITTGGAAATGGAGVSASGGLGAVGAGVGQLASIAGLSGQAGSAIGLLGSNIGALGPIGAAVATGMVGVGVAFKKLKDAGEELRREEELLLKARFTAIEMAGQTTDTLREKEEELIAAREKQAEKLALARDEVERLDRTGVEGFFKDVVDEFGIWSDQLNEAKDTLKETEDGLADMDAELKGVREALTSTETAAADAADALEQAAQAQSKATLEQVDALGEHMKAAQEAAKRDRAGNRDRLKAIQEQEKILRAQIAALKASGVSTDEATDKLKALQKELGGLGDEAKTVSKAIREGTQADRAATLERQRLRIEEHNAQIREIRAGIAERAQERKAEDAERLKNVIDFANKVRSIEFDAAKRRFEIQTQANRDQDRLMREHLHAFEQDFFQDFLGAYTRQNELAFRLQETRIAAGQALTDVGTGSYLAQQQLRAESGYQQLISPTGGNTVNITTGMDLNAVTAHLQGIGVIPS